MKPIASLLAVALVPMSLLAATPQHQVLPAPWLPLDPGRAQCHVGADGAELADGALRFALARHDGGLRPAQLDNRFTHAGQKLSGELFVLQPKGGKRLAASAFRLDGAPTCTAIEARPGAARAADRHAGQAISATFRDAASGIGVRWRAVLRDGSNYVRQEMRLTAANTVDLSSVALLDLDLDKPWVDGTTNGSPVISGDDFYGFEDPSAQAQAVSGHARMWLKRILPLRAGVPVDYSVVYGVTPAGQLRRGFQAYLENERATPFRTFLHYNSWYDIGYFTPYTQADAIHAIDAFGQKLVKDRGVVMDSFLFDDGWDDHTRLWQFSKDFPHGFTPVREAAETYGADPGMWLSPWGGYGPPRQIRLQTAKAGGYEVDDQGIALSGKKYYPLFHDTVVDLLKKYGINQFKLDGTGSPDKVTPGSDFDSDFAAAIALINDLRTIKPDLFINLTTNTWPSPFWLRTADSIWRGGDDHSFAGVGSNRQRWITYRDSDLYGGIVRQGPLFPLNSLMLHGIIYAKHAQGLDTDPQGGFADEVHGYFANGTGLQEMYVSPDLLTEADWNILAQAAKWARANAVTLRDSHWIGGDPARLQVYGQASWSPGHAIIALRNPSDRPQSVDLDIDQALELPAGQAGDWQARPAFATGDATTLSVGRAHHIELKPFQMLVWDLVPAGKG